MASDEGVEIVDFRFADLPGLMQHFSVPVHELTEEAFEEGYGFDGSSVRGFQEIQESDMILLPDPNTAFIDPFFDHPTLVLNCFVHDPLTGESYTRDPRYVAKKAEDHLSSTGLADTCYIGPEAEFFVFDDVRFAQNEHSAFHMVESVEASWRGSRAALARSGWMSEASCLPSSTPHWSKELRFQRMPWQKILCS